MSISIIGDDGNTEIMKSTSGEFITKEAADRELFGSGAVRGSRRGKGRYDLFSPLAEKRVADVNERGGRIYGDRNYEKGIPISRFIDSARRHLTQYMEGLRDEDHLAQSIWNLQAALHTDEAVRRGLLPEELADTPDYTVPRGRIMGDGPVSGISGSQD